MIFMEYLEQDRLLYICSSVTLDCIERSNCQIL